jgi:hypothetical protein
VKERKAEHIRLQRALLLSRVRQSELYERVRLLQEREGACEGRIAQLSQGEAFLSARVAERERREQTALYAHRTAGLKHHLRRLSAHLREERETVEVEQSAVRQDRRETEVSVVMEQERYNRMRRAFRQGVRREENIREAVQEQLLCELRSGGLSVLPGGR